MVVRYRDGLVPEVDTDPGLRAELADLPARVAEQLDGAEISQALDTIWQQVRRLNRYVEEQAPWLLARDADRGAELDRVLASLIEGLRVVTVLLSAYLPAATARLLASLDEQDTAVAAAQFRARGSGRRVRSIEPLFPKL
jgi:methionyl-tRNA synthetase